MSDTEDNVKSKKPEEDDDAGDDDKKEKKAPRTKAKTFEVKKWNAVCLWTYDIVVDTCAICRNHIMELCIDCLTNPNSTVSNECNIGWGRCGHAFHFHCISRWLKTRHVCPMDNKEWDFERFSSRSGAPTS
eukprot:TRINITY_DN768_c0_g1_i1.p2 TRINITY_DN768_c0_g1~~TRINITY_DN768_c0_g1_i1.p2  ORF type:complete len:131 (-),score=33.22 TRINITY_DN768_c0_g1_i1:219-611(-)